MEIIKVNESRYISLFVFSGSIKKLFSIDCVNIYLFSIFFSTSFTRGKRIGVTQPCFHRDSLTLNLITVISDDAIPCVSHFYGMC